MKKIYLSLLPIMLLASCGKAPAAISQYSYSEENGVPVISRSSDAEHVTYLMMSRYGYLDIEGTVTTGTTVPDLYLENAIIWKTERDGQLPDGRFVKSYVEGATFRGWAQYNGNTYPEYLTNVPEESGRCVYAIFDGTNAGGGGSVTPTPTPVDAYDITINVDLKIFNGWDGIENFSVYLWGANGEEPLGNWDACAGNLVGSGDVKSVQVSNLTYAIVGAIFYFDQTGGDYPGRKQTTNMNINISSEGTYKIAPTSSTISWDNEGKMTNFSITKA